METEDLEIQALKELHAALQKVPLPVRKRILQWAWERQSADERKAQDASLLQGQPQPLGQGKT